MDASDYIAIAGVLATLLFGAIAVYQTHRANRLNRMVVNSQGVFRNPSIRVSVLGQPESSSFLLAVPIRPGRVFEFPLYYTLVNEGDKTAEEVEAVVRLSKCLCYGGSSADFESPLEKLKGRIASAGGNLQTFIFESSSVHPKQSFVINHPLSISQETILQGEVGVGSGDGPATVPYLVEYSYSVAIAVLLKDGSPFATNVQLRIVNTHGTTLKEVLNEYNSTLLENHNERLSKERWYMRLFKSRSAAEKIKVVEIKSDDLVEDPDLPVDRAKDGASLRIAEGLRLEYGYFVPAFDINFRDN